MSREVCGICWCPYDEETRECACAPPATPNCSNCASLQDQNTELDRKLAEMEQTSLELCETCGWRTLIPGDCCLNCVRQQPKQLNNLENNSMDSTQTTDKCHRCKTHVPLTDEEIEKAYREIWRYLPSDFDHTSAGWIEMGIKYAERAHGIGGAA